MSAKDPQTQNFKSMTLKSYTEWVDLKPCFLSRVFFKHKIEKKKVKQIPAKTFKIMTFKYTIRINYAARDHS